MDVKPAINNVINSRSRSQLKVKVTGVEVSAFSEYFLFIYTIIDMMYS